MTRFLAWIGVVPRPWPATWCRVVAMHMHAMESGTGYRRSLVREEWP